jgi:tetratricopeptide (TPR) repeat protein
MSGLPGPGPSAAGIAFALFLAGPADFAQAARNERPPAEPPAETPLDPVRGVLSPGPADTLIAALRQLEGGDHAGEAALRLGELHYARGEYSQARQAFARAQTHLGEPSRSRARLAEARSWLALGQPSRARETVADLATGEGAVADEAALLVAQSHEREGALVRALGLYERLLNPPRPGANPIALGRAAELYRRLGRPERSRQVEQLLLEHYPESMEAVTARMRQSGMPVPSDASEKRDGLIVQIGSFTDAGRARTLASRARQAGFTRAEVVSRGTGAAATHAVQLGIFDTREEAVEAGRRSERLLGVTFTLVSRP